MNFIDYIVLILILVFVLFGIKRGFVSSLMNMGAFFVSWIGAFLTYPLLSDVFIKSQMLKSFTFYLEGGEKIADFVTRQTPISQFSQVQIDYLIKQANFPSPFGDAIASNISSQAFAAQKITSIGDYFDATLVQVSVNIISFLLIFIALRIVFTVIADALSYSINLPALKHYDAMLGGGIGLLRGGFAMFIMFCIIPIALLVLPVQIVSDAINGSTLCTFFYNSSVILPFIGG